ncbi:hypothetical protein CBS147326_9959 [Penicillium roqueforti]|nr:hypothetical protein CBS147326_9959 [Penicillium roqueforti]
MKGPDPVDNAGERRIPRGGSLQESEFRVWPAAIDPQTPTVPGAKRPPGFGHRGGGTKGPAQLESPITKRPGMMKTPEGARHNYTGAWAWEGSGVAGSRVPPLRPSPSVDRLFAPSLRAPSPHPAGRAAQLPLPANWRLTPVSLGREAPPAAPPPQG